MLARRFSFFALVSLTASGWVSGQELLQPLPAPIPSAAGEAFTEPPVIPPPPASAVETRVASENPQLYELEELLQLASRNNPTLRQARLHVSAELAKALQAGLYPNPVIAYEAEQIGVDVEGDTDSPGEFQGGVVTQRFVTGGKLRLSREKYLRRAHVSEHLVMAQRFRVCNDLRIRFYRALAASQRRRLREELQKTAEDSAVTAQEAYNMGQARRPEVRKANVALQRARLDLLSAQNAEREAFRKLSALVGLPLTEGQAVGELAPQCSPPSFDDALGRLIAESPELAAARAKLSVDRATIDRERVEWVPDLVATGGAGYNFEAKETTAVAGLALEFPLYDRNQGTIRQAESDYARQRYEVRRVELSLRDRLAETYQRYVTALQHAYEYEQVILPESKAAYKELLDSYKRNRVAWYDVLDAQHDYFDAQLTQVDNLVEARTHEVLVFGYLLHGGLMAAEGPAPAGHINATPQPR